MVNFFFSCKHCGQNFPLFIGLQQHFTKHLNKCKLYQSATLVEQEEQQKQQHQEQQQQEKQQQEQMEIDQQDVIGLENDDQSSLLCPFCDKLFKNLGSYHVHLKNHSVDNSSDRGHTETNFSGGKS